jgi:hypothetical protein
VQEIARARRRFLTMPTTLRSSTAIMSNRRIKPVLVL